MCFKELIQPYLEQDDKILIRTGLELASKAIQYFTQSHMYNFKAIDIIIQMTQLLNKS